ncbi:MAG: cysteinyl-tRNA synthetase [Actinomycetota bacterium]|nr:cysteinyl-tRNA synthetase [Actinomycetota bacterium]
MTGGRAGSVRSRMSVPLRLHNTLTRDIRDFTPRTPPRVGMYSCGPTVYAYAHIGNMRTYVFSDTLRRALRWKGFDVLQVMNITDVGHLTSDADEGDDKLEVAAKREQRNIWEIAEHYTRSFKDDLARLRILEPDVWCKATDHIPQMIDFAEVLDGDGWCYELPSGLYFDTSRDADYGALARLDLEGQREGARVELVEGKRNPSDFAVWRTSAPDEHRQMEWESPWGRGAPGWHLECSVMSITYLGRHFDVHTGGVDHIPVHHTNEIAQSDAYLGDGERWVDWWLHGEFINLKAAKMSKSSGDTLLVSALAEQGYHPLVYRYLLLQAHYRSQVEFSWDAMDSARTGLRRLLDRYASARVMPATTLGAAAQAHRDAFDAAISDDLNTAKALAAVGAAARDAAVTDAELSALATDFDAVLAIGLTDLTVADLDVKTGDVDPAEIDALVAERDAARAAKDFARSDALRDELAAMGVTIEDHPARQSTWRWS